ncbi:MAG: hypothetical protein RLZZ293_612 [Pseudomonadota bacterium]|jgi:hypothetical protein
MKKILLALASIGCLVACNNGSQATTSNSTVQSLSESEMNNVTNDLPTAKVTYLYESMLPISAQQCFHKLPMYTSNLTAVNNNGVVAGSLLVGDDCLQHGYLWDAKKNTFEIIPFPTLTGNYTTIVGSRISSLSTNLVTGGITFTDPNVPGNHEYATYNNYFSPWVMLGWNYVFGVSEDGKYVVGSNFAGQPLLWDVINNQSIALTISGNPILRSMLSSVSNNGIVAAQLSQNGYTNSLICKASTGTCEIVDGGKEMGYDSYLNSITHDGRFAYGWQRNGSGTHLYKLNVQTNQISLLIDNYYIPIVQNPDSGVLVVHSINDDYPSIYVESSNKVYLLQDLLDKLHISSQNIALSSIRISPNSKYLTFDVTEYANQLFGVKIYFPLGIATYLNNNLTAHK